MGKSEEFLKLVNEGYSFKGESIKIGCAVLDGEVVTGANIQTV